MKEVTLFCCEICGTEYPDKESAENCERFHKIPVSCKGANWKQKDPRHEGYPFSVIVEFSDGSHIKYGYGRNMDKQTRRNEK